MHEVALHAQDVRHLAGGHGDDLLDHAVGIGQRILGLVHFLIILVRIVCGLGLDECHVLERNVLGLGGDGLVCLEFGIGHIDLRVKSHGSSLCPPHTRRSNTY